MNFRTLTQLAAQAERRSLTLMEAGDRAGAAEAMRDANRLRTQADQTRFTPTAPSNRK